MGFLAKDEDSGARRIDERISSREQSIGRFMRTPCDEVLLLSARTSVPSADAARPWILRQRFWARAWRSLTATSSTSSCPRGNRARLGRSSIHAHIYKDRAQVRGWVRLVWRRQLDPCKCLKTIVGT